MHSTLQTTDIHDQSGLRKLLNCLKKPFRLPLFLSFLIIIISYLQVLLLIVSIQFKMFNNRPSDTNLINIIKFMISIEVFGSKDPIIDREVGLLMILAYQLLQICLVAAIMIKTFVLQNEITGKLFYIVRCAILLNFYIFYLPIQSFVMEGILQALDETITLSVIDPYVFLGLGITVIIMNFLFSIPGHITYSQIPDKDYFSKRNPKVCSLAFFYKMIMCFLVLSVKQDIFYKWTLIIISVLYVALSYFIFYRELIFYNLKIIKLFALIHGNLAIYAVVILALGIWDEIKVIPLSKTTFIVWGILLPFGMIAERSHLRNMFLDTLRQEGNKTRSEAEHFKKLAAFKWIFIEGCKYNLKSKKQENNSFQMMLIGLVRKHIKRCYTQECPCDKVIESQNEEAKFQDLSIHKGYLNQVMKNMIEEVLTEGMNQVKNGNNVILNKAYFHLKKEDNFLASYITLKQLQKKKRRSINIYMDISMGILQKKIEENIKEKSGASRSHQEEKLKLSGLIRHNELVEEIKSLMVRQTEKQLEVWDFLNEFSWNAEKLFKLSRQIETFRNKIEHTWKMINADKHNDIISYLLFGLYNSIINNNIMRSEKLLKKIDGINLAPAQSAEVKVSNENLYDSKNIFVTVGMERERLGKIESCSKNVTEALGFTHEELIGSNVGILMPNSFRKKHQNFLTKYLSSSKSNKILNKHRFTFGVTKRGYAVPINLYVSVYPSLRNGLSYLAIMRPIRESKEYILLNTKGFVDSCTENIGEELGISVESKEIHVSEICPEIGKISDIATGSSIKLQTETLFTTKGQEKKTLDDDEGDEMNFEKAHTLAGIKGERTYFNEKYDKSLNMLIDQQTESVSPRKTTFVETLAMETTFRAINKNNSVRPVMAKKKSLASNQNKKLYEKLTNAGEIMEFSGVLDNNPTFNYYCQLKEEDYDGSILRVLTLTKGGKNIEGIDNKSGPKTLNNLLTANTYGNETNIGPKVTTIENNEEDTLLEIIPDERTEEVISKTGRSNGLIKTITIDPVSYTSRFKDLQPLITINNEKDKSSLELNQHERGKEWLSIESNNLEGLSPLHKPGGLFGNNISRHKLKKKNEKIKEEKDNIFAKNGPHVLLQTNTNGSEKRSKLPAVINTDPIRKLFQQHSLHIKKDIVENNSSNAGTSSSASSNRLFMAVEKAFSQWKKLSAYGTWLGLAIFLTIASFTTLVTYFLLVKMELGEIIEESQSLFHVGRRLNAFLELNYDLQLLALYIKGYVKSDRHVQDGIPDFISYIHEDFADNVRQLDSENSILRTYVDGLTKPFQDQLYRDLTEIQVINETNQELRTLRLNTFDAVTRISMFGIEIGNVAPEMLYTKQLEIESILDNSFNSLLAHIQQPYDTYASKIRNDFDQTQSYFIISLCVMISIFLFVFLHSITELKIIARDTSKFWESLLRFDLTRAESHKTELKIMLEGLQKDYSFNELFTDISKVKAGEVPNFSLKSISKGNFSKDSVGFIKKQHNWNSIKTYVPTLLPMLLSFIIIISTFAGSKVLILSEADKRDTFVIVLETIFETYQLQVLTVSALFQYVAFNESNTILRQPVKEFVEENLETIGDIKIFVNRFQSQGDPQTSSMVEENLCKTIFAHLNTTYCETVGEGAHTKGLSNIISFLTSTLEIVNDFYTENHESPTVVYDTINLEALKGVEIELSFLQSAFEIIASNLEVRDRKEQQEFSQWFFFILFVVLATEFILWVLLYAKAYRSLCCHKENHALVIKNIPVILIWESKLMRSYIYSLFRGSFQSMKT